MKLSITIMTIENTMLKVAHWQAEIKLSNVANVFHSNILNEIDENKKRTN